MLVAFNTSGYGFNLSDEGYDYIHDYLPRYRDMDVGEITRDYTRTLPRHDRALTSCIETLGDRAIDGDSNVTLVEVDEKKFNYEIEEAVIYSTGQHCENLNLKVTEDYVEDCIQRGDVVSLKDALNQTEFITSPLIQLNSDFLQDCVNNQDIDTLKDALNEMGLIAPTAKIDEYMTYTHNPDDKYEILLDAENTRRVPVSAFNPQTQKVETEYVTFHRIRALKDFGDVKAGQTGGFVESGSNLSQDGESWIADNALVGGKAKVSDAAIVSGDALITESAFINGNATITDQAKISGNAHISGNAVIEENGVVDGEADISEYVRICGNAHIGGNALLREDITVTGYTEITRPMEFEFEDDIKEQAKQEAHETMNFNNGLGEDMLSMAPQQDKIQTQDLSLNQQLTMVPPT